MARLGEEDRERARIRDGIDLLAIKERHASDEATGEADAADTHADRGLLLKLVDRLLSRGWETQDTYEDPICFFCGALITYTSPSWDDMLAGAKSVKVCDHAADCPVPPCRGAMIASEGGDDAQAAR